jgi:hypothetical protein
MHRDSFLSGVNSGYSDLYAVALVLFEVRSNASLMQMLSFEGVSREQCVPRIFNYVKDKLEGSRSDPFQLLAFTMLCGPEAKNMTARKANQQLRNLDSLDLVMKIDRAETPSTEAGLTYDTFSSRSPSPAL